MQSFLNGNATLQTLTPEQTDKGQFYGGDERGMVAAIVRDENFTFVEYAEFSKEGVVRGNHKHREYHERLFCISGRLTVEVWNDDAKETFEMTAGSLLDIKPGNFHKMTALEPSQALSTGYGADPFNDREKADT